MQETERFEKFFSDNYEQELGKAISEGNHSVDIDFTILDRDDPELADMLLDEPNAMIASAKEAITSMDLITDSVIKITPRFKNLPEQSFIRIKDLRSKHLDKLITLDGVVRRASDVKPEISIAHWKCPECDEITRVFQKEKILKHPKSCDSCGAKKNMDLVKQDLKDMRFLVIEDPFETATSERRGNIPIYLTDDLTTPKMQRRTEPGTRLLITGSLRELKKVVHGKIKTQLDIFFEANHVQPTEIQWEDVKISEEDEAIIKQLANDPKVYEKIIGSIATSMFGMEYVKEAIAYQLFGGVPRKLPDGTRLRGDIHILLVGDPAVGKTQLLKLVSDVMPRGKYVSGKGVSGVGLTASVTKDEEFMGGWVLEAGAMVLCHKGMISIDEFDKIAKDDQVAMHEAMSTQTISVAKASIFATLPAETAVLGGANPRFSRFDRFKSVAEQVDIPDTLLSRFDLKFILRDIPNKEQDEKLAEHIVGTRTDVESLKPMIDIDLLRKYIAYVKNQCEPDMTVEAARRLKEFYVNMRNMYQGEDASTIAITLRQYEAMIRISEAAAKIRLSDKVEVADAERAIKIMKISINQLGYDEETGKIDIDRTEGTSSSKRHKISVMLDILDKLTKQIGKEIPENEFVIAAIDEGLKEREVKELIQRLEAEGLIYRPRPKHIGKPQ
ncbi:MAG: minichromosome maintenance protein MCM [Candidatus Aenigmarchaeota archaeon]|nr:minichromosome maintenance protein MCM [Candidatus Aenigmarchaeota archaeon]